MLQSAVGLYVPRIRGWDWISHKIRVILFTYKICKKAKGRKVQSQVEEPLLWDEVILLALPCNTLSMAKIQDRHSFHGMASEVMWHGESMGLWLIDQSPGGKLRPFWPFPPDSDMHRTGLTHESQIWSLYSALFVRWYQKDMVPTAKSNLMLQEMY